MRNARPAARLSPPLILCVCFCLALLVGCQPQVRVIHDPWESWRQGSRGDSDGPGAEGQPSDAAGNAPMEGWAIRMASFQGRKAQRQAEDLIEQIYLEKGIQDLWSRPEGEEIVVYRGRFMGPNTYRATSALQNTRLMQITGHRPFASARLVALNPRGSEGNPMNLRSYQGAGDVYSLEVGLYNPEYGDDFREAAEQAARTLRQEEQVEAFFYHGPNYSSVTVGRFSSRDFVQQKTPSGAYVQAPGQRMKELRKRFPHRFVNGRTLKTINPKTKEERLQRSQFTRLPQY